MSLHGDWRQAFDKLRSAFEAIELAPSLENIEAFEDAARALRELHEPVKARAFERARLADERRAER